jgi:hypothetical protein
VDTALQESTFTALATATTIGAANAAMWTDIAIATLTFAGGSADIEQWRTDNRRYLARLQKRYPTQYRRIEDAIKGLAKCEE